MRLAYTSHAKTTCKELAFRCNLFFAGIIRRKIGVFEMAKLAVVRIVISVPLTGFENGAALKASGDILGGHWINLSGPVSVSIEGVPEGTDLVGSFNAFRKTLTLRHVTSRKAAEPKSAKVAKVTASKLFG